MMSDPSEIARALTAGAASTLLGRFRYDVPTDRWWWSDEVYRMHGFEPGEVVPTTAMILAHKHPEDRARYATALSRAHASLRKLNEGLEETVKDRVADLSRANQEIQRFAYIVSHDLRSPLVNVMGFTAELEAATKVIARSLDDPAEPGSAVPAPVDVRRAVEEDLPEAIGFIRSSTQKMDRLINAILRLSREGRRTLAPELLDLNALVRSIADTMQHRLTETGTALTIAPLPMLTSDRTALEQILSNLMENALKYLQPGRAGEIRVSGSVARGRAIIEVADNGRGIDPRDHERIFDLFRRSGVQDQPGEGIGLAHVRALAYRLGGVIEVVSELGQGATFRVNLPIEWKGAEANG